MNAYVQLGDSFYDCNDNEIDMNNVQVWQAELYVIKIAFNKVLTEN